MSESAEFPAANDDVVEHVHTYIKCELEEAGIAVHKMCMTDATVITDIEVPPELSSKLREYAADKGIVVEFQTSSNGR